MDINSDNININNMPTEFFDDWNLQDANIRYESTIQDETLLKLGKRINQSETELKTQRQNRIRTLIRNRLEHESIARNRLELENIITNRCEQENIITNRCKQENLTTNRSE